MTSEREKKLISILSPRWFHKWGSSVGKRVGRRRKGGLHLKRTLTRWQRLAIVDRGERFSSESGGYILFRMNRQFAKEVNKELAGGASLREDWELKSAQTWRTEQARSRQDHRSVPLGTWRGEKKGNSAARCLVQGSRCPPPPPPPKGEIRAAVNQIQHQIVHK